MTDRYENIRKALAMAMGPTPGPWSVRYDYVVQAKSFNEDRLVPIAQPYGLSVDGSDLFANARLIAACDPDTIRELLAERDALVAEAERLEKALKDIRSLSSINDAGDDEEYAYQAELESARAYLGIEETPASTPTGDFGLNAAQLEHKHGEEHPDYTREDWREEVENGDTRLCYWEWVMHQVESRYYDPCDNCGETDCEKMFAADHGYVCKACASDLRAPDEDDVAEWVGLHYKVNFDSEPDDRKADWIRRYTESMAA